jgi:hypothetical protein
MRKIDHTLTDEVVCPHCGYEHGDSWEWGEGEQECESCKAVFMVEIIITVEYTTTRITTPEDGP